MKNYNFTYYSNDFDLFPEGERADYIISFCCENNINEQQADIIAKHTEKFSDYAFAKQYFAKFPTQLVMSQKFMNQTYLIKRCKARVASLAKQYVSPAELFSRTPNV